jgi:hypothetical protein
MARALPGHHDQVQAHGPRGTKICPHKEAEPHAAQEDRTLMGLLDYLYGRRDTGQPLLDGDTSGVDSVGNPLFVDPRDAAEGKRRFTEALATMPSVQAVKEAVTAPVDAYQGKFDPLSEEGTAPRARDGRGGSP